MRCPLVRTYSKRGQYCCHYTVGNTALTLMLMNWDRLYYYQAQIRTAYLPTGSDLVLLFVNYLLLFFSSVIVAHLINSKLIYVTVHFILDTFFSAHLWYILIFWALLVSLIYLDKFQILCWFVLDCDSLNCKSWEISTPTDCSYQTSVLCHDLISCFSCRTHFTENITQWIAYSRVYIVTEFKVIFSVKCVWLKEQLIMSCHRTKVWYEQSVGVDISQDLQLRLLNCNQEQNNFSWCLKCRWPWNSFEISQKIEKSNTITIPWGPWIRLLLQTYSSNESSPFCGLIWKKPNIAFAKTILGKAILEKLR